MLDEKDFVTRPAGIAVVLMTKRQVSSIRVSHRKSNPKLKKLCVTTTLTGCLYQPATRLDSLRPKVPRL